MEDPQIQKVRRFFAKEQYINEKIAALTSKHQLTGNQEMYALMLEKMLDKNLIRRFDANLLALDIVAQVTVMQEIADREPDRTEEMWTQTGVHMYHIVEIYGKKKNENRKQSENDGKQKK